MKEISLTRGKVAVVDDDDFERVSQHKWCFGGKYAQRKVVIDGKHTSQLMHRFIVDAPDDLDVDHRYGDKLNNQRYNLRVATRGQNIANQSSRRGSSRFKGVSWNKKLKKWRATISVDGKSEHCGLFVCEVDAAIAYDMRSLLVWGEFAKPNLPVSAGC